ncbi:MAG TPA: MiaB/RimO family radical SAM methylthiotransferase [Tepidisphaeraceae bacterium]|nr:MiaB/RimO family radical SAM methylthiotransferase [Tepidisphaeraceae bacterium]
MMRHKLYMETFGCQMNLLDSMLVLGQLRARGYEPVESYEQADVVIYNTCSVREHAEQKVWSRLGELRFEKRRRPKLVIAVIGCMAEREGTGLFTKYPHVDILCGPAELDKLPAMVHNAVVTHEASLGDGEGDETPTGRGFTVMDHSGQKHRVALMGSTVRRSGTLAAAQDTLELLDLSRAVSPADDVSQAYVRITRGCNKFCSYCVVPYTRGPEVHRPPQNIIDEVKKLTDGGAREVTLLGQTINHYAYKHPDGRTTTFADLLYMVHEATPGLPRLRFVTSFPRDFTDAALQAMRDCSRICRYLHVPAQSGSDRMLKLMSRGYTVGEYREFIDRARGFMPDLCLASDFIVGFPSETEEDHQQTLELMRYARFKNCFVFKYSPRPGTVAIKRFQDDVPEETKRRRNNEALAVQQEISIENNRQMIGKTVEVIVEGESKLGNRQESSAGGTVELGWERKKAPAEAKTQLVGRTRGDQIVCFDGEASLKGQILQVAIVDAQNLTLFGKRVAAGQEP